MDIATRQDAERQGSARSRGSQAGQQAGRASGAPEGEGPTCPRCGERVRQRNATTGKYYSYCSVDRAITNAEWKAAQKADLANLATQVAKKPKPLAPPPRIATARSIQDAKAQASGKIHGWPPRYHTKVPQAFIDAGDGEDVIDFLDVYGRITKDSVAGPSGDPLDPREWQKELIRETFARDPRSGRFRHRTVMWGMARKNGKTGLVAPIALYGLMLGGEGAEVYSAAADRPQAKLMLTAAKRTVELIPELKARLKLYRDAIEDPVTGSVYKALSADAYTKEGLSPTLVLADELHAWPNRDLYDVLALAMGARYDAMMLIVTTAGVMTDTRGQQSIANELFEYGLRVASGEIDDPTFFLSWWAARENSDIMDEKAWAEANPGLDDILDLNELRAAATRARHGGFKESEFRIKRLNQWVPASTVALPGGMFEALSVPAKIRALLLDDERPQVAKVDEIAEMTRFMQRDPKEPRVIFFDGSFSHDCTALVEVFLDGFIKVLGCWEKPQDDDSWRVPMGEVANVVYTAVRDTNVLEVAADPFRWQKELQDWEADDIPVVEFPTTSPSRMVPAWAAFYDAVMDGRISHDGDPRLERHMRNTALKVDRLGPRPVKQHTGSFKSIDLAICAVGGYARAMFHAAQDQDDGPLVAWG